jgi:hypothetical protein
MQALRPLTLKQGMAVKEGRGGGWKYNDRQLGPVSLKRNARRPHSVIMTGDHRGTRFIHGATVNDREGKLGNSPHSKASASKIEGRGSAPSDEQTAQLEMGRRIVRFMQKQPDRKEGMFASVIAKGVEGDPRSIE